MHTILNLLNQIRTLTFYFLKFNFNIIITSMQRTPKLSFHFKFSDQNLVCSFRFSHSATCPARFTFVDFIRAYLIEHVIENKE
jgi:hypothetical protein